MQGEIQRNILVFYLSLEWTTGVKQSESTDGLEVAEIRYSRWRQNKGKQTHMKENLIKDYVQQADNEGMIK